MADSKLTKDDHDRVVQHIAKTRFPFPDQTDWPSDYRTITNAPRQQFPVRYLQQNVLPDIVIVNKSEEVREVGEVEIDLKPEYMPRLMMASQSASILDDTDIRHFFLYVPESMEERAKEMLRDYRISYAGLRVYSINNGEIVITSIETPGHDKDHR